MRNKGTFNLAETLGKASATHTILATALKHVLFNYLVTRLRIVKHVILKSTLFFKINTDWSLYVPPGLTSQILLSVHTVCLCV